MLAEPVDAETVRPLRRMVLRPGAPHERLRYPLDDAPDTLHAAVFHGEGVIGIASVMRDPHPVRPTAADWRIRGMATAPAHRGRGVGRALLSCCEAHARGLGGARLWCNARVAARAFYERAGLTVEGEPFEIATIGRHYLMSKSLE